MSQSKTWTPNLSNTKRLNWKTATTAGGSGGNRRLVVGRIGSYDYTSYLRFALDWTGVGKIVSAVLTLYTDDGFGTPAVEFSDSDAPYIHIRRLSAAFSEHTSDPTFVSADFTDPSVTTASQRAASPLKAPLHAVDIDITGIIEAVAPKTVKQRSGAAGVGLPNNGIAIAGDTTPGHHWSAISDDAETEYNSVKPVLVLTYEYGATIPDVPTSLSPVGAVDSIGSFQGNFTDPRPTDQLRYSEVQVFTPSKAGTAATTDVITVTGHGLINGDFIFLTSLTGGAGLLTFTRYCVRDKTTNTFKVTAAGTATGAVVDITTAATALTIGKLIYNVRQAESNAAIVGARFDHIPGGLHLTNRLSYRWRGRVIDQEGQISPFTALTAFSVNNTDPVAPVLSAPSSISSLNGVHFTSGPFSDADNDTLLAYQIQLSAYASGDPLWDDDSSILWNTGKVYVKSGSTSFDSAYGGASLGGGTYYWRARVWDSRQGLSDWSYRTIVISADFIAEANDSVNSIVLRSRAKWRIIVRAMGTNRGPGKIVAVIEDAYNVGASVLYNSPGEAHWTMGIRHPQLSVIEPKQTHYAIEFWSGDGWREVYAGLIVDMDASDRDVIFYGIDYLGLLDSCSDENYDPANPDKAAENGGSKYVTVGKNSISYIINDQLTRAKSNANSIVKFISTGSIASMTEQLVIFSTYTQTLSFIVQLLDSHRAGTGKRSRIFVRKTATGYEFVTQDDPGITRDNLRLRYGELVQGYRVVPFGPYWASNIAAIGRNRDGLKVEYGSFPATAIDESVWGHWVRPVFLDGIQDSNDFKRRAKQTALTSSKLGRQVALGLRSGVLQPRDGYDVCDQFPVDINHGAVDTDAFGSGYWVAVGVTWTALQRGDMNTTLTLQPREDSTPPDDDLIPLRPISPQAEWQIGWKPPSQPAMIFIAMDTGLLLDDAHLMDDGYSSVTGRFFLDQTTGKVYELSANGSWVLISSPPTVTTPSQLVPSSRVTLNSAGVAVANLTVAVTA